MKLLSIPYSLRVYFLFPTLGLLPGCAPTVNVATPEPVKIDVNMKVVVSTPEMISPKTDTAAVAADDAAKKRRDRMKEIQTLKNDHVIGENRTGYLEVHTVPTDKKYADYAAQVVAQENADRQALYTAKAKEKNLSPEIVESQAAEGWRDIAYPKEWIQNPDGSWVQK